MMMSKCDATCSRSCPPSPVNVTGDVMGTCSAPALTCQSPREKFTTCRVPAPCGFAVQDLLCSRRVTWPP